VPSPGLEDLSASLRRISTCFSEPGFDRLPLFRFRFFTIFFGNNLEGNALIFLIYPTGYVNRRAVTLYSGK
jgi:hypothetical protein